MTDNTEALPPLPSGIDLTSAERYALEVWRHESMRIALAAQQGAQVPWDVRKSAEFTREDLGPTGKNYPHIRALLGFVESLMQSSSASPQAPAQPSAAAPSAQAEPVRQLHSFSSIDCEKLIAAAVPGGSACDPQEVADSIRRYLNAWPSEQAEPQVPLTDEQIVMDGLMMTPTKTLESCADAFTAGVRFAERYHGIGKQEGT